MIRGRDDAMAQRTKVYRTELTPVSFLTRNAYVFPDSVAVAHGERRYSYRQLAERVNRLASALRGAGVGPHDRVAFLCPNIPAMLEAHFGVPAARGVLVAVNIRLSSDEIGLEDEEETISINYTSGTTGRPKGVMYTHRGAYMNAIGEILETGMTFGTRYLWTLPMFHCNGWCFPWAVTAVAGVHICLRRVDPGRIWEMLDTMGVTHYNGAPTVHIGVVNHPTAHRLDRSVTATVAGAPPSPTLLAKLKELNFRPVHVYGLTETYGPHTVCGWHPEWDARPLDEQA